MRIGTQHLEVRVNHKGCRIPQDFKEFRSSPQKRGFLTIRQVFEAE